MKRTILLLFVFLLVASFRAYPTEAASPDSVRLQQMYELAQKKNQQKDRLQYIESLYNEAKKCKNKPYEASAMFLFAKHYYTSNIDSMYYWSQQAVPMLREQKRYEEMFRIKAWIIYNLSREKKNKEALDAVNELKALAKELNYPDGEDMANQALANYYFDNNLRTEGVALYEEVLTGMEKRNVPLMKRVHIIKQLTNRAPRPELQLKYIDRLREYVEMCESEGIENLDEENPVYKQRYTMHRSYAVTYTRLGKLDLALEHLRKAESMIEEYKMGHTKYELMGVYIAYYCATKEYDKAVNACDSILTYASKKNQTFTYQDYLHVKAKALFDGERYREAATAYADYAQLKDSLSSATYFEELANMKTQHNVDKLEIANKQMEMDKLKDHSKMLFLLGGMIVLLIICFSLGYLAFTIHRFGRQLKAAKEKAEEADRLKSAFLANMNHEIRTPLNAISGFSQLLAEEDDRELRAEYSEIVQNNNELLQRLIADVLDISKIESDTVSFQFAYCDLPAVMKGIYNVILLRMGEGVELQLKDCDELSFYTDRNRFTQIMTNLLTNAIKHTEKGFIRYGYSVTESEVHFFVRDSGEGIPEEQLERIFSRFVQLNEWTKGVGLGLAISKGLIQKMGGTIRVESEVGVGSVFYVTLPNKK